jgi:HSP20 family protein
LEGAFFILAQGETAMRVWRWDPFDELVALRESMEHLFDDMFSARPPRYPRLPVMWETAAEVIFRADLPEDDPQRIEVSLIKDTLTVKARALRRSIALPTAVAPGLARATYRDGVLEVRMPKVGEEKGRHITVEAA